MFNTYKKLVVDWYAGTDFAGLWGNENTQDPICAKSRTGFLATFSIFPHLWVSKLQSKIAISKLDSEYVVSTHYVRALITLKSIFKEVIDNLGIDSEKLKFISSCNFLRTIMGQ